MPRIQIDLPPVWLFRHELPLRVADINYGGHLGNDRVLGLVHDARVAWLQALGLSEGDVGGAGLIMAEAGIVYRSEAFLGETVVVELGMTEIRRAAFDLTYRLSALADGRDIALVRTSMVCFDYVRRRPAAIPQTFRAVLED